MLRRFPTRGLVLGESSSVGGNQPFLFLRGISLCGIGEHSLQILGVGFWIRINGGNFWGNNGSLFVKSALLSKLTNRFRVQPLYGVEMS